MNHERGTERRSGDERSKQKGTLTATSASRIAVTLALCLAIVLAGCTGFGGLDGASDDGSVEAEGNDGADGDGGTGDGSSDGGDGADGDGGDGDDTGSVFGDGADGDDNWFNLTRPGYYEFDLAGIDDQTGEQVTGRLVYDVEDAGDGELTTNVDYQFGDEQFQTSTTGTPDEVSSQLLFTPAHAPVLALQGVSLTYLFEMGFTDPNVGNRKSTTTDEGTQVTEVTEERSYAGLECYFVQTTLDGEVTQEGCIRGSNGGIAPYAATYTDEGELELKVELVEFERR